MDDKRQKNQLELAFMEEDRGEVPKDLPEGTESSAGKRGTENPAIAEQLMEEVCERENCKQALKRVKANKGSAGVDGMTVQQLPEYLKQHCDARTFSRGLGAEKIVAPKIRSKGAITLPTVVSNATSLSSDT